MKDKKGPMPHEIICTNTDISVKFFLSEDTGSSVSTHWHNSMEIVYVMEGSLSFFVEENNILLTAGDFVVVNSRALHSTISKRNRALVLQIPEIFLEEYIADLDCRRFYTTQLEVGDGAARKQWTEVKRLFYEMYVIYYSKKDSSYLLHFYSRLYEALGILLENFTVKVGAVDIRRSATQLELLKKITSYLHKHHRECIHVKDVAGYFGYHPDYLSRFFKHYMSLTILEYLYTIRTHYVYQDLIETDRPIGQIFEQRGCQNYKVSMRCFHEIYGCTPKEKRKQMRTIPPRV
jgi:AraC-type DNA-binding domain-containing proteins